MKEKRKCIQCGKELPSNKWRYCTYECRAKILKEKYIKDNPDTFRGKTSATTGAISELRVAVDLLAKGYDVFRALSPSCPCDLAILRNGQLLRLEVRTTYKTPSGKLYKTRSQRDDQSNIDVYVWVSHDEISYEPALE